MATVDIDMSEFNKRIPVLMKTVSDAAMRGINEIADEILRLSRFEVPHDKGMLQASGNVEQAGGNKDYAEVGYNKVYAARLHEHPEYRFQKGRKGKYLEDPIKKNLATFIAYMEKNVGEALT